MARRTFAVLIASLALVSCGDDEDPTTPADPGSTASTPAPAPPPADTEREEPNAAERRPDRSRGGEPERDRPTEAAKADASAEAEEAYTSYIEAINQRDGEALCRLLPPDAERLLRPPVDGADCAARLADSIGYEDPRGYPVWTETNLNAVQSVSIGADPSTARLTASIVTQFEGREPSVEDDVAYLERVGGSWRLAQPTAALYRAIGRPELPPTVIAPPQG